MTRANFCARDKTEGVPTAARTPNAEVTAVYRGAPRRKTLFADFRCAVGNRFGAKINRFEIGFRARILVKLVKSIHNPNPNSDRETFCKILNVEQTMRTFKIAQRVQLNVHVLPMLICSCCLYIVT